MAPSDDSFIREVNEELRQEKMMRAWRLLKPFLIGGAIAIILIVIGYEVHSSYKTRQAEKLGATYTQALDLANAGPTNQAFEKLLAVQKEGVDGYPMLAQFREATLLTQKGENNRAIQAFQTLAKNKDIPKVWREMASIRAGYLLVDYGSFKDVNAQVADQATDVSPMRLAAREALGLAAWKAGDPEKAAYYFNRNFSDTSSAGLGFAGRAEMMLSLISSESGKHVAEANSTVGQSQQTTNTVSQPSSASDEVEQ